MLTLLSLLQLKHFVWDFFYQPPYMFMNKGKFGHLGGIVHSGLHALTTFIILLFFVAGPLALLLCVFEFVVHYITDWAKMNINAKQGWKCNTHNEFWQLTGFDQFIHQMTYVVILLGV